VLSPKNPTIGRFPGCARAAIGHAAAPPSIVMNSRRLMGIPSARLRASRGYHIRGDACCASRQISTAYVGLPPSPRSPDVPACRNDHGHWPLNEFGYERRYSIWLSLGPAVVDAHILAFDVTGLVQAAETTANDRLLNFMGQLRFGRKRRRVDVASCH
jgi:hypothetical protein